MPPADRLGGYVAFQMVEGAIPRNLFADILPLIAELRPPVTSTAFDCHAFAPTRWGEKLSSCEEWKVGNATISLSRPISDGINFDIRMST
ncbi:MAG: hypothetical protein WCB34_09865 [Methylovirgula sp.]